MLADGHAQRFGFAVSAGIVFPYHALQARELAHHSGEQVSLAKQRRAARGGGIGACRRRHLLGQRGQPIRSFAQRSEALLVAHRLERRQAVGERLPAVPPVEKIGVIQAGAHHALGALANGSRPTAFEVADQHEAGEQLSAGSAHREKAQVFLQGRYDHRFRQPEKALLEGACEGHGPFHQSGNLIFKLRAADQFAAQACCLFSRQVHDGLAAVTKIRDDAASFAQRFGVVSRRVQPQTLLAHEAMAPADPPAALAEDGCRHHGSAAQHDHPMHRANEFLVARPPAHGSADRQATQRVGDNARQQGRSRAPAPPLPERQPLALGSAKGMQRFRRAAARLREGRGRAGPSAVSVARRRQRRAAPFNDLRPLPGRH